MMVLSDADVRAHLSPAEAFRWIGEALRIPGERDDGTPPRVAARFPDGRMVFTCGRNPHGWFGFRAYDTFDTPHDDQLVSAYDSASGRLEAIAVGSRLPAMRTGAIGANAAWALLGGCATQRANQTPVPPVEPRVAVIGSGTQAWAQMWALSGVMRPQQVTVFSPNHANSDSFADHLQAEMGWKATRASDARTAVKDAALVVLATSSASPVIETAWLSPDAVVVTVGPKQLGRCEFPRDLLAEASFVCTDSLAQLLDYHPTAVAVDLGIDVAPLTSLLTYSVAAPARGRRIFLSVGRSGTEVHLLGRLAQKLAGHRSGHTVF